MGKYLKDVGFCIKDKVVRPAWVNPNECLICVIEQYMHYLGKSITNGIAKVYIEARESNVGVFNTVLLLDVLKVETYFDWRTCYSFEDAYSRKKYLLDFIHNCLVRVARERAWNIEMFNRAHSECLSHELNYNVHYKEKVLSPDRKMVAQVYFEFGTLDIKIYLEISNRKGVFVKRVFVKALPPSPDHLYYLVGKIRWISLNQIKIYSKCEQAYGELDVSEI